MSAGRETTLRTPFTAVVTSVEVSTGQKVLRGQGLARLESATLVGMLSQLNEALVGEQIAENSLTTLHERESESVATRTDILQGEASLSQARASVASSWRALDEALVPIGQRPDHEGIASDLRRRSIDDVAASLGVVRAPHAGTLTDQRVTSGEAIAAGATLFEIDDSSRVIVEVGIARPDMGSWLRGDASVELAGGVVPLEFIGETAETDASTGLVILRYTAGNPQGDLMDGMWVEVSLEGPSRSVVWVPAASVVARGNHTFCMVREGEDFRAAEVTVGAPASGSVPVLDGLEPGVEVATEGAYELLFRDLSQLMQFVD